MSKVILHKHKHDTDYYDATTAVKRAESLKKNFKANKDMQFYNDLDKKEFDKKTKSNEKQVAKLKELADLHAKHGDESLAKEVRSLLSTLKREFFNQQKQHQLYLLSDKGDLQAIELLLLSRSSYEYEGFEYIDLL